MVQYFGDYVLLERLGKGGMGVVYKAKQVSLNRVVAVKMILAGQLADAQDITRFHLEAEAAANLDHPNIVQIYEIGEHQGQHYFSMRYVEGESLADRLKTCPLPAREAARFIEQVARAIAYAHGRGVIHRDLKPANILVNGQNQPHVTDFGLAKRVQGDNDLTASSQVLGTPSYMPPEQAAGRLQEISERSDLYSLGATLYALLVGRPPFQADNPLDTLVQVREQEPVSLRQLNPNLPRDLETICAKCLEKVPSCRYSTATEFADELRRFLDGKPIHARPVSQPERLWRWCKRQPVVAGLAATLVLMLVAGVVVSSCFAVKSQIHARVANTNATRAQHQLAISYLYRGMKELESGDAPLGLAILGQAYRAADGAGHCSFRRSICSLAGAWDPMVGHPLLHHDSWASVAFSPDGTKVATVDSKTARVWDAMTGQPLGPPMKHDGNVYYMAFSADGTKVATTNGEAVHLWDAVTGQSLGLPMKHDGEVRHVAFSPDGTKFATVNKDKTARVWDTMTGRPLGPPIKNDEHVDFVEFSPDGTKVATVNKDKTARVWDTMTGQPLGPPIKNDEHVDFVEFSPDGTKVATTSGKTVHLWDAMTGQSLVPPMKHDGEVRHVAFSPDGTTLATASRNDKSLVSLQAGLEMAVQQGSLLQGPSTGTIYLWGLAGGRPIRAPIRQDGEVLRLAFSPDGARLATATGNGPVGEAQLWDGATGEPVGRPMTHDSWVTSIAFSPDGTKLATASRDNTAHVWDATTGRRLGLPMKHHGEVTSVKFSPDGAEVVTTSSDKTARLWDITARRPLSPLMKHEAIVDCFVGLRGMVRHLDKPTTLNSWVTSIAFSRDGAKLATAGYRADDTLEARLWDVRTGRALRAPIKCDGTVDHVVLSPDGTKVATANDGTVRLWDAMTGQSLGTPIKHGGYVHCMAFSPDGTEVATADGETVHLWDAITGQSLGTPIKHGGFVRCIAFSPGGTKVATADGETVHLWNAMTGQSLGTPMKHDGDVLYMAFSPDGAKVATAGGKTVCLWDAITGQSLVPPMKHDGEVRHVAFSPDGTKVATADGETVYLWDAMAGQSLEPPMRHDGEVLEMAFSPDGTKLATASRSPSEVKTEFRLWDVATGQPLSPPIKPDLSSWDGCVVFSPQGTTVAMASCCIVRLWPVPPSLPDDPHGFAAYAELASGWKADSENVLHPITVVELEKAWDGLLRSPVWVDRRRQSAVRRHVWHEVEASDNEAAERWFAAAFHLRWLCREEPKNVDFRRRLDRATAELERIRKSADKPESQATSSGASQPETSPRSASPIMTGSSDATSQVASGPMTVLRPRSVRIVYLVSADRPVRDDFKTAIETAAKDLQAWYAKQLGGPSFRLNEPVVEVLKSDKKAKWFYSHPNGDSEDDWGFNNGLAEAQRLIGARQDDPQFVWVIYSDGPGNKGRGGNGVAVLPEDDLLGLVGQHPEQNGSPAWGTSWATPSGWLTRATRRRTPMR